ncbi:hypothetical protein A2V49_00690 [candidate division WWE3 bacterium RBG_19FT_COMBO_34_6]|uniref:Nuclear transport factor 2 family protein n=1 Tax=candidate division WWE3 bacterium RBG_19FT_COMBO_34_6 TaxID=1802612 RepID=A0A1F4UK69_UNCKA|nr:MAG: hypothetical protein A2V49_00690 [candidate division WWE3 bacterium RBG_19FT_COMBO_34_6]
MKKNIFIPLIIIFAVCFTLFLYKSFHITKISTVPLPSGADAVYTTFELINEKRLDDALSMFHPDLINEGNRESWKQNLKIIESIEIISIEPSDRKNWAEDEQVYKVEMSAIVSGTAKDAAIPNYGWNEGIDTKWIVLKKDGNLWKIVEIATGP